MLVRTLLGITAVFALSAGAARSEESPPAAEAPAPAPEAVAEPQPATEGANPVVIIKTSKGDIQLELFSKEAPATVANFLAYVDSGHYKGTIFHRVIDGFMIQGGGFTPEMAQKPTRAPVKNEAKNGLKNERGTIAMARTGDPDSATSQFFINVVNNGGLDYPRPDGHGYCVFGKVVVGMEVVDAIKSTPTGHRGYMGDVPQETIEIVDVVRVP